MPIREMLLYARLREQGPGTGPERRRLLEKQRDRVRAHLAELESCLAVLDIKIADYAGLDVMERKNDDV